MTDDVTVRVFTTQSFEGVTSVAILEEIVPENVKLDIHFVKNFDFRKVSEYKGAEVTMVLGHGYHGGNLPEEFYTEVDVPFQDFIHCATYGVPINGSYLISTVNEDTDPIKVICNYLKLHPESSILGNGLNFTEKAEQMIEAVNAYRTWTWERNGTTKMLLSLYQAFYKYLPRMIKGKSLSDIVKEYAPIIKGQLEKMNDVIAEKTAKVKTYNVTVAGVDCILKVVFAEEYINELANSLLTSEGTTAPVIVCVGRTTRGGDIFSIRTRNIHAGRIAHIINEGNGKENVGSVFTGVGYAQLMGNSIVTALSQYTGE